MWLSDFNADNNKGAASLNISPTCLKVSQLWRSQWTEVAIYESIGIQVTFIWLSDFNTDNDKVTASLNVPPTCLKVQNHGDPSGLKKCSNQFKIQSNSSRTVLASPPNHLCPLIAK